MFRTLRYWMNESSRTGYQGPREAVVLMQDDSEIRVPLAPWGTANAVLSSIPYDDVLAVFIKSASGTWSGEAVVADLDGQMFKVYSSGSRLNEAIDELTKTMSEQMTKMAELDSDPAKELEERLKRHDWYACMSDSYSSALAGEADMKVILELSLQVDPETAKTLWNRYAPGAFTCPV